MVLVDTDDRSLNWFSFIVGLHQLVDPVSSFSKSETPVHERDGKKGYKVQRTIYSSSEGKITKVPYSPSSERIRVARFVFRYILALSYPRTKTNLICDCVCDLHNDLIIGSI